MKQTVKILVWIKGKLITYFTIIRSYLKILSNYLYFKLILWIIIVDYLMTGNLDCFDLS